MNLPRVEAQMLTHRGFVEVRGALFPQDAPNDSRNLVVDLVAREEGFLKPASWIQFAGGLDVRMNTHDQVRKSWMPDVADREILRPTLSVRRATATLTNGPLTVDIGKQFIRWGKADIVTPTDRFAPRDFLNVIDNDSWPCAAPGRCSSFNRIRSTSCGSPFLRPAEYRY